MTTRDWIIRAEIYCEHLDQTLVNTSTWIGTYETPDARREAVLGVIAPDAGNTENLKEVWSRIENEIVMRALDKTGPFEQVVRLIQKREKEILITREDRDLGTGWQETLSVFADEVRQFAGRTTKWKINLQETSDNETIDYWLGKYALNDTITALSNRLEDWGQEIIGTTLDDIIEVANLEITLNKKTLHLIAAAVTHEITDNIRHQFFVYRQADGDYEKTETAINGWKKDPETAKAPFRLHLMNRYLRNAAKNPDPA